MSADAEYVFIWSHVCTQMTEVSNSFAELGEL